MQWQDLANAVLEMTFVVAMYRSACALLASGSLQGVSASHVIAIAVSAVWFPYYYAHLGQWFSLAVSLGYFAATAAWVGLILWYAVTK